MLSKADAEAKAMTIIAASHFSCSIVLLSIGIQVFMCFYGLSTFLETPREMRKGRLPYITFSFIILFTSGITTAFTLYFYVFYFENLYTSGPNIDYIIVNQELANGRMWTVDKACTATDTLLGHGLLVYRCYIIWKDIWWVTVAPALVYATSIATHIHSTALTPKLASMSPEASKDAMRTTLAAMACTAAANALITILISSRLLIANRSLSKVLPGRSVRACSRAVTILVESAVPLSLCGLISVGIIEHVLSAPGVSIKYVAAGSIFDGLYSSFAALSPQMIIFRVTTGRSFMRHEETKVDSQRMRSLPFSQPLAFNHGTTPAGLEKANLKEAEFNEAKGTSAV